MHGHGSRPIAAGSDNSSAINWPQVLTRWCLGINHNAIGLREQYIMGVVLKVMVESAQIGLKKHNVITIILKRF